MSAWSVKPRRAPSRHFRDARGYGHTTTAMHDMSTPPPHPRFVIAVTVSDFAVLVRFCSAAASLAPPPARVSVACFLFLVPAHSSVFVFSCLFWMPVCSAWLAQHGPPPASKEVVENLPTVKIDKVGNTGIVEMQKRVGCRSGGRGARLLKEVNRGN